MDCAEQCGAVIPCYNEGLTIGEVVRGVREWVRQVWVVDDGSEDATAETATAAGAQVIRHRQNLGKGAALKAGLQAARAHGCRWAFTLDGDGQHSPDDLPLFLARLEQTQAALLVGNRIADAWRMPWLRRAVNRWMSRRVSRLAGQALPDSQCGFRLVQLEAWSGLRMETGHFEIESEMLLAFCAAGYAIEFVPIQVLAAARPSRIHPLADSWRWLRWWRRACRSRAQHGRSEPESRSCQAV